MIEICVDSVESAVAAQQGGADRLELCSALVIGGLSPTRSMYETIRTRGVTLPIRAMVRPRFGDFLYTDMEKAVILTEAKGWATTDVEGIVTGALLPDGSLDRDFLKAFIEATPNKKHTLHRAFDLTSDPFAALETAIELGFDTILTSGQSPIAPEGIFLIRDLVERAAGRITILAGAGVNASVIPSLKALTKCEDYHLSAKSVLRSGMTFRREGVPMGLPGMDEYGVWRTDVRRVKAAVEAARGL